MQLVSAVNSNKEYDTDAKTLTPTRCGKRLGVRVATLRDWFLKHKHLDFVKAGRAVCVTEESIERFIQSNLIPARERN